MAHGIREVVSTSESTSLNRPCDKMDVSSHQKSGTHVTHPGIDSSCGGPMAPNEMGSSSESVCQLAKISSSHQQSAQIGPEGAGLSDELVPSPQSPPPPPPPAQPVAAAQLPEKRKLPPFPEGDVTQEEGEAFCSLICKTYPEIFDQ